MKKALFLAALFLSLWFLTGCGGGGGDSLLNPLSPTVSAEEPSSTDNPPTPTTASSTSPQPKGVRFQYWYNDGNQELTTAEIYSVAKKEFETAGVKAHKVDFYTFAMWVNETEPVPVPGSLVVALGEKDKTSGGYRGATLNSDGTIKKIGSILEPIDGKWATSTIFLFAEDIY